MLKAYAVALIISTSTPVAADQKEGLQKQQHKPQENAQLQGVKPRGGAVGGGSIGF